MKFVSAIVASSLISSTAVAEDATDYADKYYFAEVWQLAQTQNPTLKLQHECARVMGAHTFILQPPDADCSTHISKPNNKTSSTDNETVRACSYALEHKEIYFGRGGLAKRHTEQSCRAIVEQAFIEEEKKQHEQQQWRECQNSNKKNKDNFDREKHEIKMKAYDWCGAHAMSQLQYQEWVRNNTETWVETVPWLICYHKTKIAEGQETIKSEKEISKIAGVVNKLKLYEAAAAIKTHKEYLDIQLKNAKTLKVNVQNIKCSEMSDDLKSLSRDAQALLETIAYE